MVCVIDPFFSFAERFNHMDVEFIEAIGALITESFKLLTALGNSFNWFIIVIIATLGVIWIKKMADYNKEADRNGTLK